MPANEVITWDIYRADLTELDSDGWVQVKPDYYGEKGGQSLEIFHPYGFYSRPLDPVRDTSGEITDACPLLVAWHGGEGLAFLGSDPRKVPGLPPLKKGESVFYGPAANYLRCSLDGSVSRFCTSTGTVEGQLIQDVLGPDGWELGGPWGKVTLGVNGYRVRMTSGASFTMGGIGGMPSPLDQYGTYAILSAAMVKVRTAVMTVGPEGSVFDPVAKSTPTLILATAIQGVLSAIAAGGLISAAPGSPCVPNATLLAALATLASTLTGAQTALPSTSLPVA